MAPREHTLSRLLRERGHHLSDPVLFARARAEAHAAEEAMIDDDEPTLADEALDLVARARLAGASDLAVRVLPRLGRGDPAMCRHAETEDEVCRALTVWLVDDVRAALGRNARGEDV